MLQKKLLHATGTTNNIKRNAGKGICGMGSSMAKKKETFEAKYRWAVKELSVFDGICPRDCKLCEEKEILVLMPGESRLIADEVCTNSLERRAIPPVLDKASESYISCPMQCAAFNYCRIYEARPIDCRSFPAVPEFASECDDVRISVSHSYCPIAGQLPTGFVETVKHVWQELSPYLPKEWKRRYNDTPSPP